MKPSHEPSTISRRVRPEPLSASTALPCSDTSPSSVETGGTSDVRGKLRLADGGTLYLEGIQHLRREWQELLIEILRALEVTRSPRATPQHDVRVIVSTTRDIDEELAAGHILPELGRALRRTLDLAPLRARLDDLSILARHIVQRQAEQAGRTIPSSQRRRCERLKGYRWPGNMRELRSVLECALATSQGPILEIGDQLLDDGLRVGSYRLIEQLGRGDG